MKYLYYKANRETYKKSIGEYFRNNVVYMLDMEYYPQSHRETYDMFVDINMPPHSKVIGGLCRDIGFLIDCYQFILHRCCRLGSFINTSIHSIRFDPINKIFDRLYVVRRTYDFSMGYNEFVFIAFFNYPNLSKFYYTTVYNDLFKCFTMDYKDSYTNYEPEYTDCIDEYGNVL